MKAILVNDDRSLRWDDVPNPEIKSEEVLVEIHVITVHFFYQQRKFAYRLVFGNNFAIFAFMVEREKAGVRRGN